MEYELYLYCTGMGTLIIFLIILYHLMGEEKGQQNEIQPEAASNKNWFHYLSSTPEFNKTCLILFKLYSSVSPYVILYKFFFDL